MAGTRVNDTKVLQSLSVNFSTSHSYCATRPSVSSNPPRSALGNIRQFLKEEIFINKQCVLGKGVFGKCFLGAIGPQQACIKIMRKGKEFEASFHKEANILPCCCHPNIALLFGICQNSVYKMLLISFHGIHGHSYSIHSPLCEKKHDSPLLDMTSYQWKELIIGVAEGPKYLHGHDNEAILHNDIKEDIVVLEITSTKMKSVIIDFGKACFERCARKYALSSADKELYRNLHPQIAPEVRDGCYQQSKSSDIYSFGRIITSISCHFQLYLPYLNYVCNTIVLNNQQQTTYTKLKKNLLTVSS